MQNYQEPKKSVPARSTVSNLLIVAGSAGLVIWSFRLLQTRFTSVISRDAVMNGVLIEIKAPEEGTVSELRVNTGGVTAVDKPLFTLKNERVSQLQVQQMQSQISKQQADLESAKAHLAKQLTLMAKLSADQQNQYQLENMEARQSANQVASDLKGAQARYRLAQLNYERAVRLRAEGAIAQANLDTADLELEQRRAEVQSLENRLSALRTHQQAIQFGLSLSRDRGNFDPRIRLEELQMQIADQRQVIQTLQQNIKDAQAELTQAKADLKRKQTVMVNAPTTGVVWSLSAQRGKLVKQGESLGQILDCNRRWVDVFVDERAVRSLQTGTPAIVELYGSISEVLQGRVSLIRSGLGRLAAGEDLAVPIAPNLHRNAQVRVDLTPGTEKGSPQRFCYVGYTGKVTFKVR